MNTYRMENGLPTIDKAPAECLDYTFEFADALAGDTITAHTVKVDGVAKEDEARAGSAITVWVAGGMHGVPARIRCTADTAGGRRLERCIVLKIADR